MKIISVNWLRLLATPVVLLLATACGTVQQKEFSSEERGQLQAESVQLADNPRLGFTCKPSDTLSGAMVCSCRRGATGRDSCTGMARICEILGGTTTECVGNHCACAAWLPRDR